MNNIVRCFTYTFLITMILSCVKDSKSVEETSDLITITNEQFAGEGMQLGKIESQVFKLFVKCNATVVPLPGGLARISAPVSGPVKAILVQQGQSVAKNQILLEVNGNEIIEIQKEYVDAAAQFNRLKNNYERVKLLYAEKVITEKEFINAESDFLSAQANYISLRLRVETLGLSVSNIENGSFYTSYFIKSPIDGNISRMSAHLGSYVNQETTLVEVADPKSFQLELSVYPGDIAKLAKGQSVMFRPVDDLCEYQAYLSSVGVSVDENSKSILCYASINTNKSFNPVANQYVESEIIIGSDTVLALPSDAVVKSENKSYVLSLQNKTDINIAFKQVEVKTNRQLNGLIEIIGDAPTGDILIKGAYNIVH
ncbi:MAG: efflux RND transporter periplasmic adaptor subunit [Paludibacter sp.]|nr:efflux RND transporter periplasmic adaptor subunit [Paludibacter sp.]